MGQRVRILNIQGKTADEKKQDARGRAQRCRFPDSSFAVSKLTPSSGEGGEDCFFNFRGILEKNLKKLTSLNNIILINRTPPPKSYRRTLKSISVLNIVCASIS